MGNPLKPLSAQGQLSTWLVLFSVLTIGVGQSMTFALLAPLGREVGFGEIQIGLIISCSALTFTLTSPVWGRNSDRWGRKPVLLLGLFGYTFGCALFATSFYLGLQGLLTGALLYLSAIGARVLMASLMSAAPGAASFLVYSGYQITGAFFGATGFIGIVLAFLNTAFKSRDNNNGNVPEDSDK